MYVIYSKDNCAGCVQAENLLKMKGVEFQILKLDKDFTKEQLFERALPFVPRTFPAIFNADGTFFGDLTTLRAAAAAGEL